VSYLSAWWASKRLEKMGVVSKREAMLNRTALVLPGVKIKRTMQGAFIFWDKKDE